MDTQKKNFFIIMFTNFLVAGSTTMIMPFLSLYIESLGNFTDEYVQRWSGLVFGVTFVAALIMSPIWGRIADKYGFKPILIINGSSLLPWHLSVRRLLKKRLGKHSEHCKWAVFPGRCLALSSVA